jgi:hypothetical protein
MPSLRPHQSSSVHLQPLIESQDLLRVKFYIRLVQDLTRWVNSLLDDQKPE